MKTTMMMASALLMAVAAPAFAGDKEMMKEKFDMHDTDNNGSLNESEWNAAGKEMWMKADMNKDGKITFEEKMSAHEKEMKDRD